MLTFLKVKDFAIIDDLQIEFGEGFNVITGETGAGKSIIMNALSSLINQKIPSDSVRTNVRQAEIVGHFQGNGGEYILKRIIGATGRSRAFFNEEPVTLARMEELGTALVNIYGQHELHHLLDKEHYPGIVDRLLGLTGKQAALADLVERHRKISVQLNEKKRESEGRTTEISLLTFQIDEIERENIGEGEEEETRERLSVLKNAERIRSCLHAVRRAFYEDEPSVESLLKSSAAGIRPYCSFTEIENICGKIDNLTYEVEDIFNAIMTLEKGLEFDPEELAILDERLARIGQMKRKYGQSVAEIQHFADRGRKRLEYLMNLAENVENLEEAKDTLGKQMKNEAEELSLARKEGVSKLSGMILDELRHLSMKGVDFSISVEDKGSIDETGADEIDFLISTNPGEPLKPVRKIASGGELSRIMLAIKSVIGGDSSLTLIFDEIDAGIGGKVADMVGRRLSVLGGSSQILCITHLPQIAVYGGHHYLVEKSEVQGRTKTDIRKLGDRERVDEIARMLGGTTITDKTIHMAEEMLTDAQKSGN